MILELLPDDLLTKVFAWTPLNCHGRLRLTSKKIKSIIDSDEFRKVRTVGGFVEKALVVYIAGVSDEGEKVNQIWALRDGRWYQTPLTVGPDLARSSVISVNSAGDSLLFTGNFDRPSSYELRIMDGVVRILPMHHNRRAEPAVCHFGKCTFLLSGVVTANHWGVDTSSVEMFDPTSDEWTELPPIPCAVKFAVAGVIGDKVYVAGGMHENVDAQENVDIDLLQIFDTESKSWDMGPPLPETLTNLSGVVLNDKFYVIGCSGVAYVCYVFDKETQAWFQTSPICHSICRSVYYAVEHNGQLLAIRCDHHTPHFHFDDVDWDPVDFPAFELQEDGEWERIPVTKFPDLTVASGLNKLSICGRASVVLK